MTVDGGKKSQWLRGLLDLCLLAVIGEEPAYGYAMTQRLAAAGLDGVAEGSIYPALARLQKDGLIEAFLAEAQGGPPRKYYRLTAPGQVALAQWAGEWEQLAGGVASVLERVAR
ncbi:PadR family transcriptional regulator [Actinocorallia lasiicapitis]